jgi:hypothetical protein
MLSFLLRVITTKVEIYFVFIIDLERKDNALFSGAAKILLGAIKKSSENFFETLEKKSETSEIFFETLENFWLHSIPFQRPVGNAIKTIFTPNASLMCVTIATCYAIHL